MMLTCNQQTLLRITRCWGPGFGYPFLGKTLVCSVFLFLLARTALCIWREIRVSLQSKNSSFFLSGFEILKQMLSEERVIPHLPLARIWEWQVGVACRQTGHQRLKAIHLLLKIVQCGAQRWACDSALHTVFDLYHCTAWQRLSGRIGVPGVGIPAGNGGRTLRLCSLENVCGCINSTAQYWCWCLSQLCPFGLEQANEKTAFCLHTWIREHRSKIVLYQLHRITLLKFLTHQPAFKSEKLILVPICNITDLR